MPTYATPNVYVEEISVLPPSVAAVSTAIPAFIGYTAVGAPGVDAPNPVAVKIGNLVEYEALFGGADPSPFAALTITNGVVDEVPNPKPNYLLYHCIRMFFINGGGDCYVISVGNYSSTIDNVAIELGLTALRLEDEPTLILFPDATKLAIGDYGSVAVAALSQCEDLKDRFTVMDVKDESTADIGKIDEDIKAFRDAVGLNNLKYGASYYPYLQTTLTHAYVEDNILISGTDATPEPDGPVTLTSTNLAELQDENTDLYNKVLLALGKNRVILPPSSSMVGIYSAVDSQRGVWKAPANVSVASVTAPTVKINDADQESLNIDVTAGKSVNAIRSFTGKGTLVWGARTLAGNDNEWRYLSVRRLFIFIEESIQKSTSFAVFEPNTALTWLKLQTLISSFLTGLWKAGALVGSSSSEAFFVNVGLGKSMTPQDILEGRLIVEIGIAASRPAEFIILRFSHKLQES